MSRDWIEEMNYLGSQKIPFLFVIDFEMKRPVILPIEEAQKEGILFKINNKTNGIKDSSHSKIQVSLNKYPIEKKVYAKALDNVQREINMGNSYLLNLTFPTPIHTNLKLSEVFQYAQAPYKLLFKNDFVCFSPEIFVKIENGIISSYPMKGTIDAAIPNAKSTILSDKKESAEHHTIVDLIRNDLSQVAKRVRVTNFRYIDTIETHDKTLLQVSSKIEGELPKDYSKNIGTLLRKLLPAGSISGAPKDETLRIIKESEIYDRGYYTGIMGYFDGTNLDSGVMIRFIEKTEEGMIFKSGGGITTFSELDSEYNELIDKVYVPIH